MTIVFGLVAWREMGIAIAPLTKDQPAMATSAVIDATNQKPRILQIAAMNSSFKIPLSRPEFNCGIRFSTTDKECFGVN